MPVCPADSVGQGFQGADQAEFVQDAGAQAAGDPADLVEAGTGGLLDLVQVGAGGLGCVVGDPFEFEQDRGEGLADLVVEFLGDAVAFGFLGGEGAGVAGGAFGFEAVEHRVERA